MENGFREGNTESGEARQILVGDRVLVRELRDDGVRQAVMIVITVSTSMAALSSEKIVEDDAAEDFRRVVYPHFRIGYALRDITRSLRRALGMRVPLSGSFPGMGFPISRFRQPDEGSDVRWMIEDDMRGVRVNDLFVGPGEMLAA